MPTLSEIRDQLREVKDVFGPPPGNGLARNAEGHPRGCMIPITAKEYESGIWLDVVMSNATELCGWPRGLGTQGITISEDMDGGPNMHIYWLNAEGFERAQLTLEIQDEAVDIYDCVIPLAVSDA